jgi:hypothetical protein
MADKKTIETAAGAPIVVNFGKRTKKAIKKLKKGEGKMAAELQSAIDEVRARLPEADKAKQLFPVVMFVERKVKKSGKLPFSPLSMLR